MFCEAGPVKIRLAAREVPDLDPGPLVGEFRQQPSVGSSRVRQNGLISGVYPVLEYATLLAFAASVDNSPRIEANAGNLPAEL